MLDQLSDATTDHHANGKQKHESDYVQKNYVKHQIPHPNAASARPPLSSHSTE